MHRNEGHLIRQTAMAGGWLLAALLSTVVLATQIPEPVRQTDALQFNKAGDGQLSWWGFDIYKAALWTVDSSFDGRTYNAPVMLSIEYQRDVSRERLLRITEEQWHRLNRVDTGQQRAWLERLRQIWPDVQNGDLVACLVYPNSHTRFYNHSELLGVVDDPRFGPEFLAIWLDPLTEFKELRAALFGRDNGVVL